MTSPLAVAICAFVVSMPCVLAHGGQYRGPGTPVVPPVGGPGGDTPRTGGPGGPSAPSPGTPTTGANPGISDDTGWQVWWELNKDPFVQQDTQSQIGATTGSDDFYLGRRRAEAAVDRLLPTTGELTDRVVPALVALLEKERHRDVQTACLMALGKIGLDGPGIELEKVLTPRLARDDQEVRETAALALGASGRSKALPILLALVGDEPAGRRLCERDAVGDRTRAFAAYSLGLLALHSDAIATKQAVHDALLALLRDERVKSRDLRAAVVNGLGILCDPQQAAHKRLAWLTVDELLAWYQLDLGRGDETVQAQAPVAIGRLLGRGSSQLHQRCKQHFLAVLGATNHRSNAILQSAALALGMLGLPSAVHAEDAAIEKGLQAYWDKGLDRQARFFALAAMGRIGGAANRTWLLETYRRASKSIERPWVALSLGLIAAQGAARGDVDAALAQMLLDDLPEAPKPYAQSALAIAVGLTGHAAAAPAMQRLLREGEHEETMAGYFCVGLAMLGDRSAVTLLTDILERSKRRPFLLLQAAVGLGRLGDRAANDRLLAMLKESESLAVLAAAANAIGQIGDRRAIEPLIAMTQNEDLSKLARAFVAAALGGVGERSPLPWNLPLSRDCNYATATDTLSNGSTGVLDIL